MKIEEEVILNVSLQWFRSLSVVVADVQGDSRVL